MSKQRIISESTGLYKLSIVNKQKDQENDCGNEETTSSVLESPRRGLPISSPVRSPAKCASPVQNSPSRDTVSVEATREKLFYELASKRRNVMELKQQLLRAEQELETLELQCKEINEPERTTGSPDKLHKLASRFQQTLDEVNSNSRVIKSKQSIGNFFQSRKMGNEQDLPSNTQESTSQSPFANKFRNMRNSDAPPAFFDKLINKWQSFTVNEEDEDAFDKDRPTDKFYIKSKLDYDEDEEITSESDDASQLSNLGEDAVVSTYKRDHQVNNII
ncbi:LAFA_0G07250g1_1 [Lachancea sp. 'fantastica']|nr:LAFA_0G07250g1_1 [Lachancea sp. 'fantastica']